MVAEDTAHFSVDHIPDELLVQESGKMVFLVALLDNLKAEGHRCLVFSQSRKVLNIIQKVVQNRVSAFHQSNSLLLLCDLLWQIEA